MAIKILSDNQSAYLIKTETLTDQRKRKEKTCLFKVLNVECHEDDGVEEKGALINDRVQRLRTTSNIATTPDPLSLSDIVSMLSES